MEKNGKDSHRIRQIIMLPNGKWKTWSVKKPGDLRIVLVLVRENHKHPHNFITYGKWNIEGEFLITYSPTGRRAAHKIPSDAKAIYERGNGNAQH